MTTRRWMVAIAIVALAMGGIVGLYRLKQRYDRDAARAERFARMFTGRGIYLGPRQDSETRRDCRQNPTPSLFYGTQRTWGTI